MSNRIAVMNEGLILQIGTPREIYRQPSERFVANFIGETNFLKAEVLSCSNGTATLKLPSGRQVETAVRQGVEPKGEVNIVIRPEHATIVRDTENYLLKGTLVNAVYFGTDMHYHIELDNSDSFMLRIQNNPEDEKASQSIGTEIFIGLQKNAVQILKD